MKLRVEYLYNTKMDTTSIYVWDGMELLDKKIRIGNFNKEERLKISTKLLKENSINSSNLKSEETK